MMTLKCPNFRANNNNANRGGINFVYRAHISACVSFLLLLRCAAKSFLEENKNLGEHEC